MSFPEPAFLLVSTEKREALVATYFWRVLIGWKDNTKSVVEHFLLSFTAILKILWTQILQRFVVKLFFRCRQSMIISRYLWYFWLAATKNQIPTCNQQLPSSKNFENRSKPIRTRPKNRASTKASCFSVMTKMNVDSGDEMEENKRNCVRKK